MVRGSPVTLEMFSPVAQPDVEVKKGSAIYSGSLRRGQKLLNTECPGRDGTSCEVKIRQCGRGDELSLLNTYIGDSAGRASSRECRARIFRPFNIWKRPLQFRQHS